ncbi:MAG: hypothetical protein PHH11_12280, partial [Methylomonas sp.]|nr:hypothetical protein [Methylomonas sp.]
VDRMNGWYHESDAQIPLDKDEANELTTPTKSTPDIIEIQFNQVTNNTVDPQEKTEGQIRQSFTPVKIQLDPSDYNAVKVFYFQSTVEALKVELPYVLKAQEEFAKNLKTTGISDETVKALVDLTKNLSPTTITSTPTGTSIVTGANVKTESPDNNSEEK